MRRSQPRGGFSGRNEAKRQRLAIFPGVRGILVTASSPAGGKKAGREVTFLVENHVRQLEGGDLPKVVSEGNADEGGDVVDFEAAIAEELKDAGELGRAHDGLGDFKKKRFFYVPDVTNGVSFVRFNDEADDPSQVVCALLNKAKRQATPRVGCRFASRIIPVQMTCKPHMNEFEECVKELIAKHFPLSHAALQGSSAETKEGKSEEVAEGTANSAVEATSHSAKDEASGGSSLVKWCVQFQARQNMKTLTRLQVCDLIGKLVGSENYKVDLEKPELVVLVEVNPVICGMSVCREYFELSKYNLYRICNPEEEEERKTEAPVGEKSGEAAGVGAEKKSDVATEGVAQTDEKEEAGVVKDNTHQKEEDEEKK